MCNPEKKGEKSQANGIRGNSLSGWTRFQPVVKNTASQNKGRTGRGISRTWATSRALTGILKKMEITREGEGGQARRRLEGRTNPDRKGKRTGKKKRKKTITRQGQCDNS